MKENQESLRLGETSQKNTTKEERNKVQKSVQVNQGSGQTKH